MMLIIGALISLIVTTIITESYLFGPVRRGAHRVNRHLGVLFGCFLCMGTWVGWAVAILLPDPLNQWWLTGLAYHGLAYIIRALLDLTSDMRTRLQR